MQGIFETESPVEEIAAAAADETPVAESGELDQAEIDSLLGGALGKPVDEAGPEQIDVDASELSEEDLMAALGMDDAAEGGGAESALLDQSELDSLQSAVDPLGSEMGADALAAAFADVPGSDIESEDGEPDESEILVIQASGGGFLGLPVMVWVPIGLAPLVLVFSLVAYAMFGRPSAPPAAAETAVAQVAATAAVTETPEATTPTIAPTATAEPTEAPTKVATPEPAPELKLPKFIFSDPNEDGINLLTGQPRRNIIPEADIVSIGLATAGPGGQLTSGSELTPDGFAGPASTLEVTVTLRGSLSDVEDVSYRIDLFGRFKGADSSDLAPVGVEGLVEGSQVAFSVFNDRGGWLGEQLIWNRVVNAPVRIGDFTDFSVVQNRLRMSIPAPLLGQLMPDGKEKDDFQFFVRVAYVSDQIAVADEVGRLEPLIATDPDLVAIAESLKGGNRPDALRKTDGLSDLQLRLISHAEQRARALVSASDPSFLLAQPVAR